MQKFIPWILLSIILSACQTPLVAVEAHIVPIQQLDSALGNYINVTWLKNNELVVRYNPNFKRGGSHASLWVMHADGTDFQLMDLPVDTGYECEFLWFMSPVSLADGRLMFERVCVTTNSEHHANLLTWNPETNAIEFFYDYELPIWVGKFTFAPDLSRGIVASFTRIQDEMFWLDAQDYSVINVGLARATLPAWSPDGQTIAFFGNKSMPAFVGPHWTLTPYDLWLMPADCEEQWGGCGGNRDFLLSGIDDPLSLKWSPDGRWLAFDGNYQEHGLGIWLLEVETREVIQIAEGGYSRPEWSPDGQRLVVTAPPEPVGRNAVPVYSPSLYILDVSEVVSSTEK